MTDRELLQYAAKAAGITTETDGDAMFFYNEFNDVWEPLHDDGDALRLAVKLGLSIEVHHDVSQPLPWLRVVDREGRWTHSTSKDYAADPEVATRCAIVRAAAEIGRAME